MSTTADRSTVVDGAWQSDPTHSMVAFRVVYMGIAPFEGAFRDFAATLDERGLHGTAQATSIDVDNEQLSEHLASPDFFDVANHPELRFESGPLTVAADGSVEVDGKLVVKGNSAPVTLTAARGTTYLVALAGRNGMGGDYVLHGPPINDTRKGATLLGAGIALVQSNRSATADPGEPAHAGTLS